MQSVVSSDVYNALRVLRYALFLLEALLGLLRLSFVS